MMALSRAQRILVMELLDFPCSEADTDTYYMVWRGGMEFKTVELAILKGAPIGTEPHPSFPYLNSVYRVCPGEDKCECDSKFPHKQKP